MTRAEAQGRRVLEAVCECGSMWVGFNHERTHPRTHTPPRVPAPLRENRVTTSVTTDDRFGLQSDDEMDNGQAQRRIYD